MRRWNRPLLRTLIPLLRRKRRLARFSHSMAWSLGRRGSTSFDTCSATTVHGTGCRLSLHVTGRTVHGKVRVSLQAYLLVIATRARVYLMLRPKHTPRSSACCVVSTCGRAQCTALWRCLPVCWPRPTTTVAQVACFYVVQAKNVDSIYARRPSIDAIARIDTADAFDHDKERAFKARQRRAYELENRLATKTLAGANVEFLFLSRCVANGERGRQIK